MEKTMYALNFTNNGDGVDSRPFGSTIAVSTDVEKLKAKMQECIEEDCLNTDEMEDFDGDEYAHNFQIYRESYNDDYVSVDLESKLDFELTISYTIQKVDVL
jgi:hypothetical protein